MTINQAIKNAVTIQIATTIGGTVKITKKEARKFIKFCDSLGREYDADITEVYNGKVLLILS